MTQSGIFRVWALTINSEVIRGVKVGDAGKIWLSLNPSYREQEILHLKGVK